MLCVGIVVVHEWVFIVYQLLKPDGGERGDTRGMGRNGEGRNRYGKGWMEVPWGLNAVGSVSGMAGYIIYS